MLIIFTLGLIVLLGFAGVAIDIGRQSPNDATCRPPTRSRPRRLPCPHRGLVGLDRRDGRAAGRSRKSGGLPVCGHRHDELPRHLRGRRRECGVIEADELHSGIVIAGTTVRVAISSSVPTTVARVLGFDDLETGARAHCDLQGGPSVPIVARRYANPSGPGSGFIDHLATAATSGSGVVSTIDPRRLDVRVPASEAALPGRS